MNNRKEEDVIDLSYYIKFIRKNWIWFPVCIILSVLVAYFYVKVSPEVFEVSTSVIVNEDDNGANNLSAQLMSDIGFISSKKSFANEMLVLQSSTLIDKALQSLDFQVSYYKKEKFYDEELYKTTPFVVIFDKNHPQPVDCEFVVEVLDNNNFRLTCNQNDVTVFNFNTNHILKKVPTFKIALNGKFNQFVRADDLNVKLILNKGYNLEELQSVLFAFSIHTQNELIRSFQEKLIVETPDMESTVAKLSMKTSTPQKTIDFLNNLTSSYVNNELEKNQFMSMKTIDYINNQLNAIQSSLRIAEENLQRFRSSNELIDVNMQSGRLFEELSKMEAEKAILEINMKYYEYIDEYFQKEGSVELIAPSAMGIDDELLNSLVEELIRLNAERNSLIENNQEKSPYLRQINIRIENLKNMVAENIAYYKQSNKIALNDLNGRINQLNNEVRKMPKTQRELFGYERQFKVNDAIYSYLLQKKAEAEIAKASYQSDTEILEPANVDAQVAPKKEIILTGSFLFGLILPLLVFRVKILVKTTYQDEEEIKQQLDIPFMGYVHRNDNKENNVVQVYPDSHVTESFRKLRTHLNYFMPEVDSKVIAVSSTISKEGKSFISLNLALTLALTGNNTILVGFDLRKPKLYTDLGLVKKAGISEYLSLQANVDDIVQKTNTPNLSAIWAGDIPPNPSELIASSYTEELINQLRYEYEYIIIDTAPIGILSDGLLLIEHADLKLFVTRPKRTPIKESKQVLKELNQQKLKNIALIINDTYISKKARQGYGYYGEKKKKAIF